MQNLSSESRDCDRAAPLPPSQQPNAFPENELPKWLLRKAFAGLRQAFIAARGVDYKLLARFSHDMGVCVRSSSDLTRGIELCVKSVRNSKLGDRWGGAADRVRAGSSLAEAFEPGEDFLPPFYLPVIRAGEQSGRLDDAFAFLESHCGLLAGPASALRSIWLFPLAIMLAGSVIKVVLVLAMGEFVSAMTVCLAELFSWIQLAVIVVVVMWTPARYFVDQMRLSLPLLGPLEREIALHRFFRVLALLYSVGGHRVELMIRTAAETVSNRAARIDLLKAAKAIEESASIPEAFSRVSLLTSDEQASIAVGEMSGKLEKSFDQISDDTGSSMIAKLKFLQPILVRLVMAFVMLSIIGTLLSVLF